MSTFNRIVQNNIINTKTNGSGFIRGLYEKHRNVNGKQLTHIYLTETEMRHIKMASTPQLQLIVFEVFVARRNHYNSGTKEYFKLGIDQFSDPRDIQVADFLVEDGVFRKHWSSKNGVPFFYYDLPRGTKCKNPDLQKIFEEYYV